MNGGCAGSERSAPSKGPLDRSPGGRRPACLDSLPIARVIAGPGRTPPRFRPSTQVRKAIDRSTAVKRLDHAIRTSIEIPGSPASDRAAETPVSPAIRGRLIAVDRVGRRPPWHSRRSAPRRSNVAMRASTMGPNLCAGPGRTITLPWPPAASHAKQRRGAKLSQQVLRGNSNRPQVPALRGRSRPADTAC